jgi:hypothetical protein
MPKRFAGGLAEPDNPHFLHRKIARRIPLWRDQHKNQPPQLDWFWRP